MIGIDFGEKLKGNICDLVDAESYKAVFHSKFIKKYILLYKWFINVK
jgi:hypothetical protein